MYNVRFAGNEEIFQLKVKSLGVNLVQLYPPFPDVNLTAGFEILTKPEGGKVYGNYMNYTTIYRKMGDGSVILSGDGSIYALPAELEPPEPYIPTMEELKATKKAEIVVACNAIISAGVDVVFPDSHVEHFSLEENLLKHDQLELFGKQVQLAAGETMLEYHQDGHPCKYYTAEEMQLIITTAMAHVSYHRTYCNSLNMWIAGAETAEELNSIYYGADIPEEYQSKVLKNYIAAIMTKSEAAINADEQETAD